MSEIAPDLFRLAQQRLSWLDRRQALLAENVANADTPGYLPKDLKPFEQTLAQAGVAPVRTSPLHLAGASGGDGPALDQDLQPEEEAPDGNAVSLTREMVKVADTESAQQLVAGLYQAWVGMMRTALGRN